MIDFKLRPAEPRDVAAIVGLISELAEFEHLAHLLRLTPATLAPHLFGERPVVQSVVAGPALLAFGAPLDATCCRFKPPDGA